jgi:hypothetical protein
LVLERHDVRGAGGGVDINTLHIAMAVDPPNEL